MAVHGFVKIVEFWLLKQRHNGKNRHYEQEASKVSSSNEFFDMQPKCREIVEIRVKNEYKRVCK